MGRLQALTIATASLVAAAALFSCNGEDKASAPHARREAVIGSATTRPTATVPRSSASTKPPVKPRTLCTGAPLDRELPDHALGHGEAPGAPVLGNQVPVGRGKWTWISLWAAWCGPCKEEMPRLLQWEKRLATRLAVEFISLDDDERQFLRFLQAQPQDGVRSSYWLPEGKTRGEWLKDLQLGESPELPVQILVNPQGRVHCIIKGAIEDSDFARVSSIVQGQ